MDRIFRTLLLTCTLLTGGAAMALEEPDFAVLERDGDVELRCYAAHVVAETTVPGDFDAAGRQAFGPLVRYISGANRSGRRFPMTAPVNQVPEDGAADARHVVSFVLPGGARAEALPEPLDPRIRLRTVPPRLMAAITYSGTWSRERYREHEARLLRWLAQAGERPVGPPEFARYDGPFTLWFLRRNEALVEIAGAADRCGGARRIGARSRAPAWI